MKPLATKSLYVHLYNIEEKKKWKKNERMKWRRREKIVQVFFLCCLFVSFVTCFVFIFLHFVLRFSVSVSFFFFTFYCSFLFSFSFASSTFICNFFFRSTLFFIYLLVFCVHTPRDCADQWRCVHWWITNSSRQTNMWTNITTETIQNVSKAFQLDVCYIV